ncbi:MAG TPA: prepilin-type N-terminal cleavage/methylation domain-containing protein, partial [Polyangia bacterium]
MTDAQLVETETPTTGRASRARARDAGMTLMEIMIVFALIALIMGAVGVGAFQYFKKGQMKTAR